MEFLLWIVGLIFAGIAGYVILLAWAADHVPEGGKSLNQRNAELGGLHSDHDVTYSIIRALLSIPAGINQAPEVDEDDTTFLRHLDENGGTIWIRTEEMCAGELSPEFIIETPIEVYASFGEEGPFDSAESELDHYLNGARAISAALVDAGLEPITAVTINDKPYSL